MQVEVSRNDGYVEIKIPVKESYDDKNIRKFLDYLTIKSNAAKSQATDEDIQQLSDDITTGWWNKNKDDFIK